MGTLLADIPGLQEAVRAAEVEDAFPRMLPYLGIDLEICRIRVKQYCPLHFLYLDFARSPFIHGGEVNVEHVAQFLWIVNPEFAPENNALRDAFLATVVEVPFAPAVEQIESYLDQAYQDMPRGRAMDGSPPTYYLATLIDSLMEAGYTWPREVILRIPFAEIFQYLRRIRLRKDAKVNFGMSKAEKVKIEFVRAHRKNQSAREGAGK